MTLNKSILSQLCCAWISVEGGGGKGGNILVSQFVSTSIIHVLIIQL